MATSGCGSYSIGRKRNCKTMKKLILSLCFTVTLVGCTTTQQTTAYNTIATVEQTATVAVDDYYTLVFQGKVSTNSVPQVSQAYNNLQAVAALAATATQSGTNALASANLVIEASQLGTLIQTIENNK
jgi:pectin methylesterase-like acyl-CoA thioesterase